MTNTETIPAHVDEIVTVPAQSYILERTYRVSGETLRVRIQRDTYAKQSWGVVQVLAADKTWTHLTQLDSNELIEETVSPYHPSIDAARRGHGKGCIIDLLEHFADELILRAVAILGL